MPDTAPPADGAALTSSYLQTMLREQVVRTCTSSTRPSAVEGMLFYETDTDRLYQYDGTGYVILAEPEQTFNTFSLTNITIGNGTKTGYFQRHDGLCTFYQKVLFGSTTTISTNPVIGLPANSVRLGSLQIQGAATDVTGSTYPIMVIPAGVGTVTCYVSDASGVYVTPANFAATLPITWTTSDYLEIFGTYRMTDRYS